ncbi:hypothetical protein AMECASPLE_008183 [Ameca splendens]|uniref:Uncharacterized protein n=1 Tax=Ameca splendens TaxID=208324 RepID=A0ABV0XNU6_9TELE
MPNSKVNLVRSVITPLYVTSSNTNAEFEALSVGVRTDLIAPELLIGPMSLCQPEALNRCTLGKTCLCVARILLHIHRSDGKGVIGGGGRWNCEVKFEFLCTVVLSACSKESSRGEEIMTASLLELYSSIAKYVRPPTIE